MSQFVDALAQSRAENKRLYRVLFLISGIASAAIFGWHSSTREVDVHIPPDLRSGATVRSGETPEVPDTNVYAFAYYIWQQVNRWQEDGSKDYGSRIFELQHYFTPSCRSQLQEDMNLRHRRGELTRRTRSISEIPGLGFVPDRVSVRNAASWNVLIDAQVLETQNGVTIKDSYLRYPLRVVRYDIDRERNPWRLAIDCFGGERPQRLDPKTVEIAQHEHNLDVAPKQAVGRSGPLDAETLVSPDPAASIDKASSPTGHGREKPAHPSSIEPVSLPQPISNQKPGSGK